MKRQPTPQHLTWFLDMYRNGQLVLNPPYQRKSVWAPKDRAFFLDTIFRNYPAPPVFVHREIDDKGYTTFNVVDGKQRLETIIMFAENKISISKTFGDENINGKKFKDIPIEYRRKFWDYVLVVDFIESIEGTNIDEVFDRVNRNSKNLQPQELRHARFDGWFILESEKESEQEFWWKLKVSTKARDKRMRNVQFISELLAVLLENDIHGFSHEYLDEIYAKYDSPEETEDFPDTELFDQRKERIKTIITEMNEVNSCIDLYCQTSNNIYSLWAFLALNESDLPDVATIANKYLHFMVGVQHEIEYPTRAEKPMTVTIEEGRNLAQENIYLVNSKGASTDYPQRLNRITALKSIL
ncbi:Protein of unknown function DUF262 [Pedobacter steynii]|uniref:GmrSD restriction endonucleases N-terminal domain-containing protein n=1 Tax=Pedobacter steynii TaxID=430522 RepID=A0A1G9UI12_9SPHI|nr:DUF262 domain-containing protein [Pedobacter steynii]NQX40774.1 DUF262 domain-containing protein [Pedobacter steynii]SDM59559.1 Protein of unknown function DUF262 [Pedobacter steynii]